MHLNRFIECNVITISPEEDLVTAARLMREEHIGFLVVTTQHQGGHRPVGVLSDRDITIECVAADINPHSIKIADIMATPPLVADVEEDLEGLLTRMSAAGVRRVPVVDAAGVLVGVISFDDLLQSFAGMLGNMAMATAQQRCTETRLRS